MVLRDEEDHVRSVGALIANLQSLEFLLRGFLSTVYDSDANGLLPDMPKDWTGLRASQIVPVNHMTNYDNLGELIDKYNTYMENRNKALMLYRKAVVELRDALAHGRVFQEQSHTRFQLLKFDKPRDGKVFVTFSQTMDKQWFKYQAEFVIEECKKVLRACKLFAPSMIV